MPVKSSPKINTQRYGSTGWFRGFTFIFSVILGCQAFWLLAAELSRPESITFPAAPEASANATVNRSAAHRAAEFGLIRGDLWADNALTYADVFSPAGPTQKPTGDSNTVQQARDVGERALSLAPHDARIWLVLASIVSRFDWLNGKASAALRMSYYTGPNEIKLVPSRLMLAVTLPAISDKDFQELVARDLRIIINRKAELKPAILNAYRSATPEGQQFIRDTLKELGSNLLSNLQQMRNEG
jgi:hypothetical protein